MDAAPADEQETAKAHDRALGFLSFRPRSSSEIRAYLARKGFSEAVIGEVLDRLSQSRLVDDAEFASYWIGNRQRFSPRGRRALLMELRQKGISLDIIEPLLKKTLEMGNYANAPRGASFDVPAHHA